jgi:hypothetical protein
VRIDPLESAIATPPVRANVARSRRSQRGLQPRGNCRSLITISAVAQAAINWSAGTR